MYLVTLNQGSHPIPYPLSSKVTHEDINIQSHQQYQYKGVKRLVRMIQSHQLFRCRIRQKIQAIQPDVIVCSRRQLIGVVANTKGDIPLVYESHTYRGVLDIEGASLYTRFKEVINCRKDRLPQLVVTLTEGDATDWRKVNPHVSVIPNVVSLNVSGHYSNCEAKSVIFVGRFSKQKDIRTLLTVWMLVHQTHPDWQLEIYGGYGGQQNSLLPVIQQMGANIIVHEPTQHIFEGYLESSIFLLTSRFEPFGLVIPEAMSCGLPVVAFDCPYGPADIISDGIDGFLIKDRDVNLFAEKVCLLMDNPDLRKKMGQAGILSSQRYKADNIMPLWKELFEQLINKR